MSSATVRLTDLNIKDLDQENELKLPGISKRAAQQIGRLQDKLLPEKLKKEGYIPVVMWMTDSTESDFVPGPEIGAQKRTDIPIEFIVTVHGISVAFSLPGFLLEKYGDCTLDFIEGRFLFIDETMRAFLESGYS